MLVLSVQGRNLLLARMLGDVKPELLEYRLYTNNLFPTPVTETGEYVEALGMGYASKQVDPGSWKFADGVAYASTITWVFTGPLGEVYGFYVTGAITGISYWAERFVDGPYKVQMAEATILLDPRFSLENEGDHR